MLLFFVPPRYRPLLRILLGAVIVVLGLTVLGRIELGIGVLVLGWGIVGGIGRLQRRAAEDDEEDRYPGQ